MRIEEGKLGGFVRSQDSGASDNHLKNIHKAMLCVISAI